MNAISILMLVVILTSCASSPVGLRPEHLFNDHLFSPPTNGVNAEDVFALSDEMRQYLHTTIAEQLREKGTQQGLIDALYSRNQLRIDYDSGKTRNAAQTFRDRSGNCLSLLIMTAALASELGMQVGFQSVATGETWGRSADLYFSIGHVNLVIGKSHTNIRNKYDDNTMTTIDFLPPEDTRGQRTRPIDRETVIAMYMNNRAAETLAHGHVNDAYWWARAAIAQAPNFLIAYNTLGVIYRRHGNLAEAEKALIHVLRRDPENVEVLSNLAMVFNDQGRIAEADLLSVKLEKRRPFPPFHFFQLGRTALQAKDFTSARDLFAREVARDTHNHEFHFWLGVAYLELGDFKQSRKHFESAIEFSTSSKERAVYAAKLDRLNAYK